MIKKVSEQQQYETDKKAYEERKINEKTETKKNNNRNQKKKKRQKNKYS